MRSASMLSAFVLGVALLTCAHQASAQTANLTIACDCTLGFAVELDGEQKGFKTGIGVPDDEGLYRLTKSARMEELSPGGHLIKIVAQAGFLKTEEWFSGTISLPAGFEVRAKVSKGKLDVYSRTRIAVASPAAPATAAPATAAPATAAPIPAQGSRVTFSINTADGTFGGGGVSATVGSPTIVATTQDAEVVASAPAPAPAAPADLDVSVEDEGWCNVWIDGRQRLELRTDHRGKISSLDPGEHFLMVKDFTNQKVLVKGRLNISGGKTLTAGIDTKKRRFVVYNDSASFSRGH